MTAPDLRHVETWIFDLDNTLYPAELNLFAQVDQRMSAFIARTLNLDTKSARRLQKQYSAEHGTTLTGLIERHGIAPEDFLDYVHDIDVSAVKPSAALDACLGELDGRKIVFTNGSVAHAERIVAALDVGHHFDEIFDIAAAGYRPKHEDEAFARFVSRARLQPETAVMFDDVAKNLRPAHARGITTVWIRTQQDWGVPPEFLVKDDSDRSFVDHEADDLLGFLQSMRHRGRPQ